jgi:hypothetical protein
MHTKPTDQPPTNQPTNRISSHPQAENVGRHPRKRGRGRKTPFHKKKKRVVSAEEKKGKGGGGYGILCLFKFREVWPFLEAVDDATPTWSVIWRSFLLFVLRVRFVFFRPCCHQRTVCALRRRERDSGYCDGLKQSINQGTVRRNIPLVTVTAVTVFRGRRIRSIDLLVRVRPVQESVVDFDGSDVFPGDERQLGDSHDRSTGNRKPSGA